MVTESRIIVTAVLKVCNVNNHERALYKSLRRNDGYERHEATLIVYGMILLLSAHGKTEATADRYITGFPDGSE